MSTRIALSEKRNEALSGKTIIDPTKPLLTDDPEWNALALGDPADEASGS